MHTLLFKDKPVQPWRRGGRVRVPSGLTGTIVYIGSTLIHVHLDKDTWIRDKIKPYRYLELKRARK